VTRHSARASRALRALNEADPAIAALALWCDHRDVESGPAAETAGNLIRYGPAFDTLPLHEQTGLAAHHVLHVSLRHGARMQAMADRLGERFDAELFTVAADAIVNEALLQAGHALPRPALTLTGVLAAAMIPTSGAVQALADWDAERLFLKLLQGGRGEGSGAGRALAHARTRAFAQDLTPADGSPAVEAPQAGEDARWRQHLARAMEAGRGAGRGVGLLGHRLADLPVPTTPWEVVLRGLLARALTETPQSSHRRPARAWIAAEAEATRTGGPVPAFQPGLRRRSEHPRVVIGMDASGSIDDTRMALFMAEVTGIARRVGAEVHLIQFDAAVQTQVRLDPHGWPAQLAALPLARGGGTDFGPPLAAALALTPSAIVVLTDLDGPFGPAPRGVPVIWAVPAAADPPVPRFGRVLSLLR
jgi:hypothetical protein